MARVLSRSNTAIRLASLSCFAPCGESSSSIKTVIVIVILILMLVGLILRKPWEDD